MVLSSTVYHPMFPNSCHAGSPYRGANYPHYTNVVQQQQQQHHHTAYSEIHENGTSDVSVYPDSIDQLVAYEQYHRHNVTQSSPNQWPQNSVGSQHYQNSANHGEIAHSTSAVRLGQPQTLASDHYSFVNCVNGQVDGSNQATASDVEDEDDGDGGSTKGTESSFQSSRPGKTRTREKYRVVYSDHQRLELEKEFHYNRYITIRRKSEMASFLGLSERQIKIWFQNRRAKERKQLKKLQELYSSPNMNDPTGATTTSSFVGAGSASDPTDRFNLANTNTSPLRHLNFPQIDNVPIKHEHPASHRPTSHLNS